MSDVTVLLDTIKDSTVNFEEVQQRLDALLDGEEALTVEHVTFAVRNLGKPVGQEVAVGQATEPLPEFGRGFGYP